MSSDTRSDFSQPGATPPEAVIEEPSRKPSASSSPAGPPAEPPATASNPVSAATGETGTSPLMFPPPEKRLQLTDFIDLRTLQELQDAFSALTNLSATIRDADGRPLTAPSDPATQKEADRILEWLVSEELNRPQKDHLTAPIVVAGQTLGSITVPIPNTQPTAPSAGQSESAGSGPADPPAQKQNPDLGAAAPDHSRYAAAIQFLYLLANSIARLCYQEYELRRRVEELSTLYALSTVLSQSRSHRESLQHLLDTAAREAARTFGAKAASIRLLDEFNQELRVQAVFNLSQRYLNKGSIRLDQSPLFQQALREGLAYVPDMRSDPRVVYPQEARREGLVSLLCAGIIFQGQPIGVLQIFSDRPRQFSRYESNLLAAMAQLLGAAIHNARLEEQRLEALRVERQLKMAADVQRRMLPDRLPSLPGFQIAARYVPSFELGGDFYDFLDLAGNLGIAVADVSGKGIAASLLMAAVRSSLRAFAQDLYDIDHIMMRVNKALCRDTKANEFATLFYGVIDPQTRRFTYCNAGHEPALILRNGIIHRLEAGGMVVGVDPDQKFEKGIWDMQPGDLMLIYTDGLMDAMNFSGQRFGRERIMEALRQCADKSAHETASHILWEMRRFAGLNVRSDDTTLVVVRCTG